MHICIGAEAHTIHPPTRPTAKVSHNSEGDVDVTSASELPVTWGGFSSTRAPISIYEVVLEVAESASTGSTGWRLLLGTAHNVSGLASKLVMPHAGRFRVRVCAFTLVGHSTCTPAAIRTLMRPNET